MAARTDLLRAEIEKSKSDLAGHLAELRIESRAAARKAASRAGAAVGVAALMIASFALIRWLVRRRG